MLTCCTGVHVIIFSHFNRPAELPKLHAEFAMDYEDVFKPIIISSIKNLAATSITVDSFRFNRTSTEVQLHNMLRERLGGKSISF